jgi:ubiquinone/menaquinone biosynthesis C-methylase UbiE
MIHHANAALSRAKDLKGKVKFEVKDVLSLDLPKNSFDIIITERCLQNLPSWESQKKAILNIMNILKSGGIFLMLECSKTGLDRLQALRKLVGKEKIENAMPWHNRFFEDGKLLRFCREFCAKSVRIKHFCSTYMLVTRLISSRWGNVAVKLPNIGNFGYNKLYLIEK